MLLGGSRSSLGRKELAASGDLRGAEWPQIYSSREGGSWRQTAGEEPREASLKAVRDRNGEHVAGGHVDFECVVAWIPLALPPTGYRIELAGVPWRVLAAGDVRPAGRDVLQF